MMQRRELVDVLRYAKSKKQLTMKEIAAEADVGIRTVNRVFAGEDVRFSSLLAVLRSLDLDLSVHQLSKQARKHPAS